MQINPYLMFAGNCRDAFQFYAEVLRGKIVAMSTYEGTPAEEHTPAELRKKIIHARIDVGGQYLMGSDAPPDRHQTPQGFSVTINVDTPAEADRIFSALSQGGTTVMPIQPTFWAQRFGMLVDKYGTPWMVNCEKPAQ